MYQGIERTEKFKTIPKNNKIQNGFYYVLNKFGEYYPLIDLKTLKPVLKNIPDRGYKKITLDFAPIKKISGTKAKFKKGDLVKIKGKSWIMRVDNIQQTNYGIMYHLENDVRGTGNGNAGTYFEIDLEKISSKKVGYKSDRTANLPLVTKFMKKYIEKGYSRKDALKNANIDAAYSVSGSEKVGSKLELKKDELRLGYTKIKNKNSNLKVDAISGWNSLTAKQKALYKKLEKEFNDSGLFKIISFENFIESKIDSYIMKRKSADDLREILYFIASDY
jgi:hypothetical protein